MKFTSEDYARYGSVLLEGHPINKGLLYEYINILLGQSSSFSSAYFTRGSVSNPLMAIEVCKYACEIFLHWTPEETATLLNNNIMQMMRLDKVKPYLPVPKGFENSSDYRWLAHLMYPSKIRYCEKDAVVSVYENVLKGKKNGGLSKFPKGYFDGKSGRERAYICLQYLIDTKENFKSIEETYAFFASPDGTKFLNNNGLKLVLRDVFQSPIQYLHRALPAETRDEFLYHYYEFQYQYDKFTKEKRSYQIVQVSLPIDEADYSYEFTNAERDAIIKKCKSVINKVYSGEVDESKAESGSKKKKNQDLFPETYFDGRIGLGRLRLALQTFNKLVFQAPDSHNPAQSRHSIDYLYTVYNSDVIIPLLSRCKIWQPASRYHKTPLEFLHAVYQNESAYQKVSQPEHSSNSVA